MDGADDGDFLMELLTYSCPFSGKLRTAGVASDEPEQLLS